MISIVNNINKLYENPTDTLDLNRIINLQIDSIIAKLETQLKLINTEIEVSVFINRDENNEIQFGTDSKDPETIKLIQDLIKSI